MEKAKLGGIFSIIAGSFGVLTLFIIIGAILLFGALINTDSRAFFGSDEATARTVLDALGVIYGAVGLFCAALGVLGIVGGVYALKKKHWGLALAGAIAGAWTFLPCGVVAIIFTSMARTEFDAQAKPPSAAPPIG